MLLQSILTYTWEQAGYTCTEGGRCAAMFNKLVLGCSSLMDNISLVCKQSQGAGQPPGTLQTRNQRLRTSNCYQCAPGGWSVAMRRQSRARFAAAPDAPP